MKRITLAALVAALAVAGCGENGAGGGRAPAGWSVSGCPKQAHALGVFAFIRGESLRTVDLDRCRQRVVLRGGVRPPVRWSATGRYLAFGAGEVVQAAGGLLARPLGARTRIWAWSPKADLLAGVTQGGVSVARPDGEARRLLPEGWGAFGLALTPSGDSLAVSRVHSPVNGEQAPDPSVWIVDVKTGAIRKVARVPDGVRSYPELAGFSPDGGYVLYWLVPQAASLSADGGPLKALSTTGGGSSTVVEGMLQRQEYVTSCGLKNVIVAGIGRQTTQGKRLVEVGPPEWRASEIVPGQGKSWISPDCDPAARLVVASAGREDVSPQFGRERRSIWLLDRRRGGPSRKLTTVRTGQSDELPRFSSDGRFVAFVRTHGREAGRPGSLYLLKGSDGWRDAKLLGPIARLGTAGNYYGAYTWALQTDWYRPDGGRGGSP